MITLASFHVAFAPVSLRVLRVLSVRVGVLAGAGEHAAVRPGLKVAYAARYAHEPEGVTGTVGMRVRHPVRRFVSVREGGGGGEKEE